MENAFASDPPLDLPGPDIRDMRLGIGIPTVRNGLDRRCNSIIGYLKRHESEDFSHTQLARKLDVNKSTIGKHVVHLLERRLVIQEDIRTSKQVRYAGPNVRNTLPLSRPMARSERYRFKASVHRVGMSPEHWDSTQHPPNSKGVIITSGKYIGYTMELFQGPNKTTLVLILKPIFTIDPEKTLVEQLTIAKDVLLQLVHKYDWGIHVEGIESGHPEYAFENDQYALDFPKDFNIEVKGIGKIDHSKGPGEIEFYGVENAYDYIQMAQRVRQNNIGIRSIEKKLDEIINQSKDKSNWQSARGVASSSDCC